MTGKTWMIYGAYGSTGVLVSEEALPRPSGPASSWKFLGRHGMSDSITPE